MRWQLLLVVPLLWASSTSAAEDDLQQVLERWSTATADLTSFEATFDKYRYNHRFQTEKRWAGKIVLEPERWVCTLRPVTITPGMKSRTKDEWGRICNPYHLGTEKACRIELNSRLIGINGQFVRLADCSGKWFGLDMDFAWVIQNHPVRELGLRIDAVELKKIYKVKVFPYGSDDKTCLVRLEPRTLSRASSFKCVHVLLDCKTWTVRALKCTDTTGNEEDVFSFTAVKLNEPVDESEFALAAD